MLVLPRRICSNRSSSRNTTGNTCPQLDTVKVGDEDLANFSYCVVGVVCSLPQRDRMQRNRSSVVVTPCVVSSAAASETFTSPTSSSASTTTTTTLFEWPRGSMILKQQRSATRRKQQRHTRSVFLFLGYCALLFALTYRNVQTLVVHRRSTLLRIHSHTTSSVPQYLPTGVNNNHLGGVRYLALGVPDTSVSNEDDLQDEDASILYPSYWSHRHQVSDRYTELAAACTQSLLGDETVYDVITLEYHQNQQQQQPSQRILASRLRKRFPLATLVWIESVHPATQLMLQPHNVSLQEWWRRRSSHRTEQTTSISLQQHSVAANMSQAMAMAVSAHPGSYWQLLPFQHFNDEDDDRVYYYRLEPSSPQLRTQQQIASYLELFVLDSIAATFVDPEIGNGEDAINNQSYLSPLGQRRVAVDIERLAPKNNATTPTVGDWGSGDACHLLWWTTAPTSLHPQNAALVPVGPHHQSALEFRKGGGSITITNPFATERLLSLTYMTDADSILYAKTRISINGHVQSVVLPHHNTNDDDDDDPVVVPRTSGVGFVPPGTSVVRLEPLVGDLPFLLVGASLLAQEVEGLELEFSLERGYF